MMPTSKWGVKHLFALQNYNLQFLRETTQKMSLYLKFSFSKYIWTILKNSVCPISLLNTLRGAKIRKYRQMDNWIYSQMDTQREGYTDRQTDEETDKLFWKRIKNWKVVVWKSWCVDAKNLMWPITLKIRKSTQIKA